MGIHKRFDQHKTMEFSNSWVSLLTLFLHLQLSGLEEMASSMCRAPRCEEVHYETSQKLQAKDFFVPSVGGFFVSFWDEVHPPGDDADVVQQMVAVSVLQWLISCSNMTGMINPDPNARNGSRETIQ